MKKKQVLSRKRLALRRFVTAAVLMVLINHFFLLGSIFPRQCILEQEERQGVLHTSVVTRNWAPEIHKTLLVYLTENENTTFLGSTVLTFYGWMDGSGIALDCSEKAPLYAGYFSVNRDDSRVWYFFGRVDDPDIRTVAVSLCAEEYDSESHAYFDREVRCLTTEDFLEKDGQRYFLLQDGGEWDTKNDGSPRPVTIGCDGNGNEVTRMEIEQWRSTVFLR